MKIAFIGGGVMAEAIIGGIVDAGIAAADSIGVGEPVESRRKYLEETYGLRPHSDNLEAVDGASLTVLAVKPQSLPHVFPQLAGQLDADNTVLSIIAGANMKTLTSGLAHSPVIRVMPNTPAQIGAGMTMWTASDSVTEEAKNTTRSILQTLGEEVYAYDEGMIDMATAMSASGPAYVFLFIEALIDAGVYLGLARDVSRQLALQTVLGSTQLVKDSGKHPAELKDMVSSPGGTTIEALRALEDGGFRAAVFGAVSAAYEKSRALGG
ncbi:MAG: pyrroline-5-carboxylate reductase [Dehalococcoidia bacterium]|nr:pyrroline-5-carboxylate reductase [Dehalococcoidia bacterium]